MKTRKQFAGNCFVSAGCSKLTGDDRCSHKEAVLAGAKAGNVRWLDSETARQITFVVNLFEGRKLGMPQGKTKVIPSAEKLVASGSDGRKRDWCMTRGR